jgi:hypothetical protein
MYFLPAFFDHYRAYGIEQFLLIDDQSSDGTREFLADHGDCVVVTAPMRYGDMIGGKRAGPLWKTLLPNQYLPHQWGLCVDADEFIVLPEHVGGFPELISVLDKVNSTAAAGVMIDCYPAHVADLNDSRPPQSAQALMSRYPFFDLGPYVRWSPGDRKPKVFNDGAITRLFKQYPPGDRSISLHGLAGRLRSAFSSRLRKRFVYKVPLVRWLPDYAYLGAHSLNRAPAADLLLPILHYKITAALFEKIDWATTSKSYARSSWKYFALHELLMQMKWKNAAFLCESSVQFRAASDLIEAGLADFSLLGNSSSGYSTRRRRETAE